MSGSAAPIAWRHLFHIVRCYLPLWAGAAIVFGGLGYGYTRVRVATYSASQPLVIRNETQGDHDLRGKFASQTDLKAAQETVLELANNRNVVLAAITRLGPDPKADAKKPRTLPWPSQEDIDAAKKRINVLPPKGSEFGVTEVIYLECRESSQQRAKMFCEYVRESLTNALRDIRAGRFSGVIAELTHARDIAKTRCAEANVRLQAMESGVGSDLGELRALTQTFSGTGNTQRVISELQRESQQAQLELEKLRELESLLKRGQDDPDQLLVAGGELLASQPSLKRLKDGYIDAQLAASALSGRYTASHPKMRAAETAQREILSDIRAEIQASIDSMEPQIRVATDRIARLKNKQVELSTRLDELADMRTAYSNLISDFEHRTNLLAHAEAAISEAQASREAALSIDLISPLSPVQVGSKPIGPNDKMLLFGSVTAGLMFGFGMVFLVAPGSGQDNFGRRWSDYSGSKLKSAAVTEMVFVAPATKDKLSLALETPPPSNAATEAWSNLRRLAGRGEQPAVEEQRVDRRNNHR